jgi:hypothetical protein
MNNKTRKLNKNKKIKQKGGYIVPPTNPYFMAAAALIGGLYVLGQTQSSKTDAEPTSAPSQPQGQSGGRKFRRTRRRNKRKGGGNSKTRKSVLTPGTHTFLSTLKGQEKREKNSNMSKPHSLSSSEPKESGFKITLKKTSDGFKLTQGQKRSNKGGNKRKTRRKQKGGEFEISRLIKVLIDMSKVNSVQSDNQRHNLTHMIKTKIDRLPTFPDSTEAQQKVLMECMQVTRGPFREDSPTIRVNGEFIRIVYDPNIYIDTLPYQLQEIAATLTSKFPDNMD